MSAAICFHPEVQVHLPGFWSRRIDAANRPLYRFDGDALVAIACRYRYDD